jgi:hypothetical protein
MHESASAAQMTLPFGDGGAYPSDEEILGITSEGDARSDAARGAGVPGSADFQSASVIPSDARNPSEGSGAPGTQRDSSLRPGRDRNSARNDSQESSAGRGASVPEWLRPLLADPRAGREAQALWTEHQAYREMFPSVAQAQQAVAQAQQLTALDGAYFGGDTRAQGQLAESLFHDDPRAFGNMLAAGARVLASRDPAAFRAFAAAMTSATGSAGFQPTAVIPSPAEGGARNPSDGFTAEAAQRDSSLRPGSDRDSARNDNVNTAARGELDRARAEMDWRRGEFAAEQYTAFQERANDAVVTQVRQTIEQSLANALPSSVPDGARRRIAEDIFSEINATLQSDRELSRQVTALVGQWRFDGAAREQVVRLIHGRARALVAPVAKRIVGDWTASLVAAHRARADKQNAAARRVDLVGGGAMESVARRPLTPREVDYGSTTDEQILSM